MAAERRNKFQIICDILFFLQKEQRGAKPTHVLYKVNLSHTKLKEYLTELEQKGLIYFTNEKGKILYKITDKGLQFINQLRKINELKNAFGF